MCIVLLFFLFCLSSFLYFFFSLCRIFENILTFCLFDFLSFFTLEERYTYIKCSCSHLDDVSNKIVFIYFPVTHESSLFTLYIRHDIIETPSEFAMLGAHFNIIFCFDLENVTDFVTFTRISTAARSLKFRRQVYTTRDEPAQWSPRLFITTGTDSREYIGRIVEHKLCKDF